MRFVRYALLPLAFGALAQAQTIPFTLASNLSGITSNLGNGGTITFSSSTGQTQSAQITATFTGSGTVTISQQPSLTGSPAFSATIGSTLPLTVSPGNSFTIVVQFVPAGGGSSTAQLSAGFTQTVPSTGATAPTVTTGAITIALAGTAPAFTESYTLQSNQNTVPLAAGGAIVFPPTAVGSSAQAALNALNSGSGSGQVTSVSITGAAFRLSSVPLIPATVAAGQTFTVQIVYTPTTVTADTGQVTMAFSTGPPVTFNLQGNGSSASFTYQILQTPPLVVTPGGNIALPNTNIGQPSSVVVRVINSGNAPGTVNLVNVAGAAFSVSGLLPLPQTLAPNASLTFTINFTPTLPGNLTGTLLVNTDSFTLTGTGLGPQLQFSYTAGGSTVIVGANNSVVFSAVQITQSGQLTFDVKNTGTLPATLSSIGIGQSPSPFSVTNSPPLPLTLAPNADFSFTITFTPVALGFSTGTLLLDTTSITLSGNGTPPPPLPAYTITGPSGTAPAMSQPQVSLTLASPYPVAITGSMALSVSGTLPIDPNAQFATGGRVVGFLIPANQTTAVFNGDATLTQIGLQTGTVASSFTLTPTFATQGGNVPLQSTSAPLQFKVAAASPTLLAIQLVNPTGSSFSIQVTGYTTTRSLQSLNIQFGLEPGFNMPVSKFTFNVQPIATVWFASAASQTFGGQFTIVVPFTFLGTVPVGGSLLTSLASITATITNETGTSNSIQVTLQ